jgi:hypothetical protein
MTHHLQPEKPPANSHRPNKKEQADQPEAGPLERNDARRVGATPVGFNV